MKVQFGFGKNSHELRHVPTPTFPDIGPSPDLSPNLSLNRCFLGEPPSDFDNDFRFGSSQINSTQYSRFRFRHPDHPPANRPSSFPNSSWSSSSEVNPNRIPSLTSIPMLPPLGILLPSQKNPETNRFRRALYSRFSQRRNKKPKLKKPEVVLKSPAASAGIEMAVFDACPGSRLTEDQVTLIEAALVEALDSIRDVEAQPKFLKSFFDQGVFWMVCANENTKEWLIRNVRNLNKQWENMKLKVVEAKIPKRPIVYIDLLEPDKPTDVLHRLKNQNPGLNTSRWVVLHRKSFKTGQRMTFSIDLDSFEFLKSKNFQMSWKLKAITFRVPNKRGKDAALKPARSRPANSPSFSNDLANSEDVDTFY